MKSQLETDLRLDRIESQLAEIKKMLSQMLTTNKSKELIEEPLMNVKEVAAFTKIDSSVIYQKCAAGEIPYLKIGKLYKFKKEDILRWLKTKQEKKIDVEAYVNNYLQKHLMKG